MNLKLNILLFLLFINGGSLLALPISVIGIATNNGTPAKFQNIYIQATGADTIVISDSLGEFNLTVNPSDTNGLMRIYFLDCRSDTTDTLVSYRISTRFVQVSLFGCSAPTVAKYRGTIKLNRIPIDSTKAILLRYKFLPIDQKFVFKDTLPIASNGSFEFLNDSVSDYLLKVLPIYDTVFAATYYPNGLQWNSTNSKAIGPHLTTDVDIELKTFFPPRGLYNISGKIDLDSNLIKPGYSATGIHLLNMQNQVIDYTYVDFQNNFSFQNVAPGSYKIWVDQCGLPTEAIEVNLGRNNPNVSGLVITANENGISFNKFVGIDDQQIVKGVKVYPNPFSETLKIKLNQPSTIIIHDLMGKQVFLETISNAEEYEISSSNWKPGLYMVTIKNELEFYRTKMIKK